MDYPDKCKDLTKRITSEYIAEGNVTHKEIQELRDCVVYLLGSEMTLRVKLTDKIVTLLKIKEITEKELS
jgi:hypothetical protein